MSTLISQIDRVENRFKKSKAERESAQDELTKLELGERSEWRLLDKPSRYKTRLERLGLHTEADAIGDAQEVLFSPLERILNASELSSVEFFEGGVLAARAVARVQIRDANDRVIGHGSGVETIGCDNGSEMCSSAFQNWAEERHIKILFIEPGTPTQNAYVERFNRTVRHEWLDLHLFESIPQAQATATTWLWHYNNERPHTGIGGITPRQKLALAA